MLWSINLNIKIARYSPGGAMEQYLRLIYYTPGDAMEC